MAMNAPATVDVAIIGGGIAGLWLLDALHRVATPQEQRLIHVENPSRLFAP